jgi:uncharacterized protein
MKQIFLLKLEGIPEDGLQLKTDWEPRSVDEVLQNEAKEFKVCSPLNLNLTFTLLGKKVIVIGRLQVVIEITCVSCLIDFKQNLEVEFRYIFWPQTDTQNEYSEKELTEQDMEIGYYAGDVIDLQPIVREQVYLAVPQNPHCRESCQGLCPKCGVNWNETTCSCAATDIKVESPFEVLKKLKKT